MCSRSRREAKWSNFLPTTTKNVQLLYRRPAVWLCCVSHCLFMWPGHKNQSADYKLCRSMCSSVREAQCFSLSLSLDLALVRLALLQSPLRMRLCSKGAAALLWLRGGGAGRSCSLWFIFQTPYGSYCMYLCSIRKIGHVWSSKDTIMSTWFFSLKMQAWWFQLLHVTRTQNITGMLSFTHIVQDYWLSFSTGSHAGYAGARHNKSSLVKLIQIQHFCHK